MEHIFERLQGLKVVDCMNSNVVPISVHHTMREAAGMLRRHGISGAPVVDEHGHCVGMLSASDFVHLAADDHDASPPSAFARQEHGQHQVPIEIEEIAEDMVSKYMSTGVQSVRQETNLVNAAQMMCSCHIHRLPVLDENSRPIGIITSLDLASALVHAVNEAQQDDRRW